MTGTPSRKKAAVGVAGIAICVGALATGLRPLTVSAAANPTVCGPLWSDSSGDAPDSISGTQDPQLDIVSGAISDNGTSLTTKLTILNLTSTIPTGTQGNEYFMVWGYNGTDYETNVDVESTGTSYYYGTYSGGNYGAVGTAAGTFNPGADGTVTVTVPLANVGSPPAGTTFAAASTFGETDSLTGAFGTGGLSQVDHDPATYDYVLGSCSTATGGGGGSPATVGTGSEAFTNYDSPIGFETRDGAQRPSAGEPSIGSDWATGNLLYMAGTQVSQVRFDSTKVPPAATWNDVTPAQLANASEDSILFTNHYTNRTWAEDFLLNPTCNANMAFTDTDGGPGGGPISATTNSSWTPEQCPYETGLDHPSIGAGPYDGKPPVTATDTSQVVYYCSQDVLQAAGAQCTHSENGGLTWDPSTSVFGATSPCGALHGHIRVSPDGTMYVPQNACAGGQGMAVTQDNGHTYSYAVVPDSVSGPTDPSVAADANNTIYFGYQAGGVNSQPKIAVSSDHGATWSPSVNVGTPFGIQNAVFPEVIAGDAGRAAFAFLGTTSGGDYQLQSFRGVWYMYVAYTYDGGQSWSVVNATPNDPVQRGCVDNGGATGATYAGCRNMLDFNDITVDKQGRVSVAYTDGCTPSDPSTGYDCDTNTAVNDSTCATSPAGTYSESASIYSYATCTYGRQTALVRQACGRGLFAANDPGFFEGPSCSLPASTPEATASAGLILAGGAGGFAVIGLRRRRLRGRRDPECTDC